MLSSDVPEPLRRLLVNQLRVEYHDVTPAARLAADLGADSLDLFDLVAQVEREFDVSFSLDDENTLASATVADVMTLIQARRATVG